MPSVFSYVVAVFAFITITEQSSKSLKQIEQLLKNLAVQTSSNNRPQNFLYYPQHSRLDLQQNTRDRYDNDRSYQNPQSSNLLYQADNVRIQQQLEDDLEQALRYESDRICKATGRCGCSGGRCGRPQRTVDGTVKDIEHLLNKLDNDLNKQQKNSFWLDRDKRQRYNDRRKIYSQTRQEYGNQRQQYEGRLQEYGNKRQQNRERRQEQNDRRQQQYDRELEQDDQRQEFGKNRLYRNKQGQYNFDKQQPYSYEREAFDNRKQRKGNYNRRQVQYDRKQQQYEKEQERGSRKQDADERQQEYDDRRQEQDDRRQKYIRNQKYGEKRQQYADRNRQYDSIQEYDDLDNNVKVTSKDYRNADFDIVVLEVPESNEFPNRVDDIEVIDINESDIKDLLQRQQTTYDKSENKEKPQDILNLEEFVQYYEKIKKELTNGLLNYIKGKRDTSYLSQLLPYQLKQIKNLKRTQFITPLTDEELKTKIVRLLYGTLSNIKLLPHSKDDQTIYIPQRVHNTIPIYNRNNVLRTKQKILPLTLYQKQRQRNMYHRNFILKHAWRRHNQQSPESNYGVPFNLQVQGLGQIN